MNPFLLSIKLYAPHSQSHPFYGRLNSIFVEQMELCGPLPIRTQNYMNDHLFKVHVFERFSSIQSRENDICKGSSLSGTLFVIAINGITIMLSFLRQSKHSVAFKQLSLGPPHPTIYNRPYPLLALHP